ncbi:MAG: hypothetical protein JWM78_1006 [Verrucomicrobiaceae bacterium]|nr:hypothetical protein [Verrucomicrobiaceae bacterium]
MQQLTSAGQNIVSDLSRRYNLSQDAVVHMLIAVNNGGGSMAQFSCAELGGSGQWMRGGMTMVGDMFNYGLKMTVENLCSELSNFLANNQVFPPAPAGSRYSNQWWPSDLGSPFSSGAQNNIRYAVFPQRLAVELNGQVTVYDTLGHSIGGVSQQQGGDTSLTFSSQYGTVAVSSLPIVSGAGLPPAPQTNFAAPVPAFNPSNSYVETPPAPQVSNSNYAAPAQQNNNNQGSRDDIISLIESLSRLRDAGALTDDEFNGKKIELLSRL